MQSQQLILNLPAQIPGILPIPTECQELLASLQRNDPRTHYQVDKNPYNKSYGVKYWEDGKWEWFYPDNL